MAARFQLGMTDARMPGRVAPAWCPHCRAIPGSDCPDKGRTPRQVRRDEHRQTAALIREETTTVKPETRAYLAANRPPKFFSGELDHNSIEVTAGLDGGVSVLLDDDPDVDAYLLDRAETIRLRDWLTTHLGDTPPGADMAACAAQMDGDDRRTVADPQCGWCGNDHLSQLAETPGAGTP